MTETPLCPLCGEAGSSFLERSGVPVHQNLLLDSAIQARDLKRGVLCMCVCPSCEFVWNHAFDSQLLNYGAKYDNTQVHSPAFERHMDGLVKHLVEDKGVRNAKVVEVGCGKGSFLRKLVEYPGSGNVGVGFDPTYVGPETDLGGRLQFVRTFYDERSAALAADVVVCRHVIEHVDHPLSLLKSVHAALAGSRQAQVYFETPCVEWILSNRVVWDFFYEHCSLFSPGSIRSAFERSGFSVNQVQHVFGGQYLWLDGAWGNDGIAPTRHNSKHVPDMATEFNLHETQLQATWSRLLTKQAAKGPVALWGAGAKGVTFANLLDPQASRIACIVDVNPAKQNHFLPGTGHPVVHPAELAGRSVGTILLLNPNYRVEVEKDVAERQIAAEVIDLMSIEAAAQKCAA